MTQRIASTTSTKRYVAFVDEVVDVVVAMDNGDDGDGVLERASRVPAPWRPHGRRRCRVRDGER